MTKIIHVMSDGTERDTLKGFEVPVNDFTIDAYKFIAKFSENQKSNRVKTA